MARTALQLVGFYDPRRLPSKLASRYTALLDGGRSGQLGWRSAQKWTCQTTAEPHSGMMASAVAQAVPRDR